MRNDLALLTLLPLMCTAAIFSGQDPSVRQELIIANASTNVSTAQPIGNAVEYLSTIKSVFQAPAPPKGGLMGVLYDAGNGCKSAAVIGSLPVHALRIALLFLPPNTNTTQLSAPCTRDVALQTVQKDGASGVILTMREPATLVADDEVDLGLTSSPMVLFWTDQTTLAALNGSVTMANASAPVDTLKWYSRATLYYADRPKSRVLQYAFIVGIGLLMMSATVSSLRALLNPSAREPHSLFLRPRRQLLTKAVVESFPIVTYTEQDAKLATEQKEPPDPAQIPLPPSTAASSIRGTSSSIRASIELVRDGTAPLEEKLAAWIIPTCAICLEDFAVGESLRELPCKHRYHVECIDPWLMERSTACPMCKTDYYHLVEASRV